MIIRNVLYIITVFIISIIFFIVLNIPVFVYDIFLLMIPVLFLLWKYRKKSIQNMSIKYKYHKHTFLFSQYIDIFAYIVIVLCISLLAIILKTHFFMKGGLIFLFSYYTSNNYLKQSIGFKLMNIYVKPSCFVLVGKIYYAFLSLGLLQSFLFLKIIAGALIGLDSLFIILKGRPLIYIIFRVEIVHKELF